MAYCPECKQNMPIVTQTSNSNPLCSNFFTFFEFPRALTSETYYLMEKEAFETRKKSYIESYKAQIGIDDQLKKPSFLRSLLEGEEGIGFVCAIVGFVIGLFFFKSRWLWFLGYAGFVGGILAGLLSWRLISKKFEQAQKIYEQQKQNKQYVENKFMELDKMEYSHENYRKLFK